MCVSVNNDFAALQYGQENRLVFVFSLWYSAPRSLALEVFKSPLPILLLLLLQLSQSPSSNHRVIVSSVDRMFVKVNRRGRKLCNRVVSRASWDKRNKIFYLRWVSRILQTAAVGREGLSCPGRWPVDELSSFSKSTEADLEKITGSDVWLNGIGYIFSINGNSNAISMGL